MKIKKHSDFLNETRLMTDKFSSAEEYLERLGLVQDAEGKWNYDAGMKTILIDAKNRDLIVKNGKLTVRFGVLEAAFKMVGNFEDDKDLTSLEGLPEKAEEVDLSGNKLTSLEGIGIYRSYDLSNNSITSLKGLPNEISEDLYVNGNKLTTLEGGPDKVGGILDVTDNQLTNLKGFPYKVSNAYIESNPLKTAYGLRRIDRSFPLTKSSLREIPDKEYEFLRHKMLSKDHDIHDYMKELIKFVVDEYGAKAIIDLNLPQDYLDTMPEDLKNIYKSGKGMKKFNV